jgi:hypothetical protein
MIIEFKISPIRTNYQGYNICRSLFKLSECNDVEIPFIGNFIRKIYLKICIPLHNNSIWCCSNVRSQNPLFFNIRNRLTFIETDYDYQI